MAQRLTTYALLLSLVLGACPDELYSGQRQAARTPILDPLLPAEEAWNVSLASPPSAAGAMDADAVYIPLQSGQVVSLDRQTGAARWTVPIASERPPVVGSDGLYLAVRTEIQAVGLASGDLMWSAALGTEIASGPLLVDQTILAITAPGELHAVGRRDGQTLWTRPIPVSSAPRIGADPLRVCVSSGSRISCVAQADGSLLWDRTLAGTLGRPTVAGDLVIVGSTDNALYALSAGDGRLAWRWKLGGDVVGATADGRVVYVASLDGLLRALHRGSGNQIWKRQLTTRTTAPPEFLDGIVVVPGNRPMLSTFNAATGEPIAALQPPAGLLEGPPLVSALLRPFRVSMVAVTREGRVTGFFSTGMMFREPPSVPLPSLPGRSLAREPLSVEGLR